MRQQVRIQVAAAERLIDHDTFSQPAAVIPMGQRSVYKAGLLSLLLPGAGQFYLDKPAAGRLFVSTEVALLSGVFAFRTYGRMRKDDYREFAQVHAGIDPAGKDENFYRFLTFYDNRDEYNQLSRLFSPENPFYPETDAWNWQWDSPASRLDYRSIRNSSKSAYRRALYLGLASLGNRLLSAVHALRAAKSFNNKLSPEKSKLQVKIDRIRWGKNAGVSITVTQLF